VLGGIVDLEFVGDALGFLWCEDFKRAAFLCVLKLSITSVIISASG
jgi:hypothetical protein